MFNITFVSYLLFNHLISYSYLYIDSIYLTNHSLSSISYYPSISIYLTITSSMSIIDASICLLTHCFLPIIVDLKYFICLTIIIYHLIMLLSLMIIISILIILIIIASAPVVASIILAILITTAYLTHLLDLLLSINLTELNNYSTSIEPTISIYSLISVSTHLSLIFHYSMIVLVIIFDEFYLIIICEDSQYYSQTQHKNHHMLSSLSQVKFF